MRALRSIGAVLVGFFATALLSVGTDAVMHATGVFPPYPARMPDAMFVLPGIYRAIFTAVGGYVTARLAPDHPMRHAGALAGLGLLAGLGAAAATWDLDLGPSWYTASIPASAIPCILGGAWLSGRREPSRAPAPEA